MGQNSTEVAYGFGQLGSAYTDIAQTIVPPVGKVIVAIQFLADNTPTVLTPEKLGHGDSYGASVGPSFPEITGGTNVTALASTATRNTKGYFMAALDDNDGSDITQVTLASESTFEHNIKIGSYVLLVNSTFQEDGNPAMSIDAQKPNARIVALPESYRHMLSEEALITISNGGEVTSKRVGVKPITHDRYNKIFPAHCFDILFVYLCDDSRKSFLNCDKSLLLYLT